MPEIKGRRTLPIAQARARREIRKLFQTLANDIGRVLLRYGGQSGVIPLTSIRDVQAAVAPLVSSMFVGLDGRNAYGRDGVTALAPFPALLNRSIAGVTADVVRAHQKFMLKRLPDDVAAWLRSTGRIYQSNDVVAELTEAEIRAQYADLRLFEPNPLADYEPAHTWIDPNGHQLSDRVWNTSNNTRRKVDQMLADGIRRGRSAFDLARDLESYLLPGRVGKRTNLPYGRDASADAMRLARTEIARAGAHATWAASMANPYVEGIDWALSPSHPKIDICDQRCTIDMGGNRVRPAYPLNAAQLPPAHPHCLCNARPAVTRDAADVTAMLRDSMRQARVDHLTPYLSPVQADAFIEQLLGRHMASLLPQRNVR